MKVEYKDMDTNIHELWASLRSVGLNIDYITTDLIDMVLAKRVATGKKFSIKDTCNVSALHEAKWDKYFKELKEKEIKDGREQK